MRTLPGLFVLAVTLLSASCQKDDPPATPDAATDDGPEGIEPQGVDVFAFGMAPGQNLSEAPFPNDVLLGEDGFIDVAPLEDDPRLAGATEKRRILEAWTGYIGQRRGFGVAATTWFFLSEAPDVASFEGKVQIVCVGGPESGKAFGAEVFYNEHVGALGVFPAWGSYLVPDSQYAVLISEGVKTATGDPIAPPAAFRAALADHAIWEPVRSWLEGAADRSAESLVVGTVFTTEPVLDYGQALLDAVDAFELEQPTRIVRYDPQSLDPVEAPVVQGDGLVDYFGTPQPPFEYNPGHWGYSRIRAEKLPGYEKHYDGGTGAFGIGAVLNGTIAVPVYNFEPTGELGKLANVGFDLEEGKPRQRLRALAPFTIFLCDEHRNAPTNIPVAVFNHGGGATRTDAQAFANANCRVGIATAAIDMVFHGGRRKTALIDADGLIVPTEKDEHNDFTEAATPDWIGDPAPGAQSVAPLFALGLDADPMVIEANLLTWTADTWALVRTLRDGDWSQVLPGLSFDTTRMFHQSLSFGSAMSTPLIALVDDFRGVIQSVGVGQVLTINMPMAPSNSVQAAGLITLEFGTPTSPSDLTAGAYRDFVVAIHAWLYQRGDPLSYAPHVLRHRRTDALPPIVSSGNSWDETLFNPAQITYSNAIGLVAYTGGEEWTIDPSVPGSSSLNAQPSPATIAGNVSYGGRTATAAIFYLSRSCHAGVVSALCSEHFAHPYPPVEVLADITASESPICQLHHQHVAFMQSVLDGSPAIGAPGGSCEALYSK